MHRKKRVTDDDVLNKLLTIFTKEYKILNKKHKDEYTNYEKRTIKTDTKDETIYEVRPIPNKLIPMVLDVIMKNPEYGDYKKYIEDEIYCGLLINKILSKYSHFKSKSVIHKEVYTKITQGDTDYFIDRYNFVYDKKCKLIGKLINGIVVFK